MDDMPKYPEGAGFVKNSESSKDGARVANTKKPTQESLCLGCIEQSGDRGLNADEVADKVEIELYIVRARLAGLHKKKLIFSNDRRMGGHGVKTSVWKLIKYKMSNEIDEAA